MKITILGIPKPKQSARFRSVQSKGKVFITSYQKKEVKDNEKKIAYQVKSQLPNGFLPYSVPIKMKVLFIFPPLSSWNKKTKELFNQDKIIYKATKPDLTDNLMKGLCDAMNGIVFTDDAIVCEVHSKKIYGVVPRIEVEFNVL